MKPSNSNRHIRDARFDELDKVSQLLKDAYQRYETTLSPRAWEYYLADIMDVRSRLGPAELIVAELNGRLVGTVTLYLKSSSEQGWPQGWAGVRLLGVHPDFRSHGVGHTLMDECIRRCRQQGLAAIGLHTTTFMDVARRMYERMGFTRVPEFDFHPAPGVVVMAYRLGLQAKLSS